jgi:quercetin dioxygenase-like cupin family protein
MLYFEPGDGAPMHYHQSPETFLVIDGNWVP